MNIRGNENNDDRLDIPLYSSDDCLYIYIYIYMKSMYCIILIQ
jgi:hypothetical protein